MKYKYIGPRSKLSSCAFLGKFSCHDGKCKGAIDYQCPFTCEGLLRPEFEQYFEEVKE